VARKFPSGPKPRLPITVRRCEDKIEYQRQWRELNPNWWLKRYGISLEDYNQILETQNGVCSICATDEPGGLHKKFQVDHDHSTGEVRGLLCCKCNRGLGYFSDNPLTLAKASSYLREFNYKRTVNDSKRS
jgi:hypothetical protein